MTTAAALRIILDYLQAHGQRDQALAIAAADALWRRLETEGTLTDVVDLGDRTRMQGVTGAHAVCEHIGTNDTRYLLTESDDHEFEESAHCRHVVPARASA